DVCAYYGVDPARVSVVHLATNPRVFWHEEDQERVGALLGRPGRPTKYLLFVGYRGHYKNFPTFLRAYAASAFRREGPVGLAGDRWTDPEKALIGDLGLAGQVVAVEHPPDETLRLLYSNAAAFVYPSYGEGFGAPALEAMACGTPAVLADIPVFREVA